MYFRLFGIKFKISVIFAISLSLFLAFDSSKSFLPLLISIFVHESSHIFFLCFFNAKPSEINLDMGTINIKNNTVLNSVEEIIVLFAGPLSNLILYLISDVLGNYNNFKNINLCLFFVNMLLVDGLDGGEMFKIVLYKNFSTKTIDKILNVVNIVNIIFVLLIFALGAHFGILNYTLLFFVFYLIVNNKGKRK